MVTKLLHSKALQSALGLAISLGLIIWILLGTEWPVVFQELRKINYWALIPVSAVMVCHFLFRSWRWKYLLPPGSAPKLGRLWDCIMVGAFATFVLPLRAGEFVRPFLLTRYSSLSFSTCFVSIIVERFFDLSMVLVSFGIVVFLVPGMPAWVNNGAWILSVLAALILVLMMLGSFVPHQMLKLLGRLLRCVPERLRARVMHFMEEFLSGAGVLRDWRNLLRICGISVLVWLSCYVLFQAYFSLFGMSPPFLVSVTAAVVVALAVAAPSAPGFIGVYQAACVGSFALFGLSKEQAVAYSIVTHIYQYLIFVCYGTFVLMRDNLHLSELRGAEGPDGESSGSSAAVISADDAAPPR